MVTGPKAEATRAALALSALCDCAREVYPGIPLHVQVERVFVDRNREPRSSLTSAAGKGCSRFVERLADHVTFGRRSNGLMQGVPAVVHQREAVQAKKA